MVLGGNFMKKRIVYYLNQFYGGIGGEEKAGISPLCLKEAVGPAKKFVDIINAQADVVATIICGDNFYSSNIEKARDICLEFLKDLKPDFFVAGPAFNAGRYGVACGDICSWVEKELNVPAITGMHEENPGVDLYREKTIILKVADSARGMNDALKKMSSLASKIMNKDELFSAEEEGFFHRNVRKNFFYVKTGAVRAVEMGLKKYRGEFFQTELEMPKFSKIHPAKPVGPLSECKIALCTSGGIVPKGNPDRLPVSASDKWGKWNISNISKLTSENSESIHGGYDRTYANLDPNRVIPVDVLKDFEKEGLIKSIHPYIYYTVGTSTAVNNAERFGREIGAELKEAGVDIVVLTST